MLINNKANQNGGFVISLDFELFWGVWDVTNREKYGKNILGVKEVIPRLIDIFDEYNFKSTFATVGFLFAKNKNHLTAHLPAIIPKYTSDKYNVYGIELPKIGEDEIDDPYHFGYPLLNLIKQSRHEIATHTFCHYYCLELGQSINEFEADIKAVKKIAETDNIEVKSIVFPRNQVNDEYLQVLANNGITVYRGNPTSWIYKPRTYTAEILLIRFCRLLDTYFPISGYNTHLIKKNDGLPTNVPASRFLKPYNKKLAFLEKLKLKRILNEMTKAAERKHLYHLWWHPHNFGVDIDENFKNLAVILNHYTNLKEKYGFANYTMSEAAEF
jgi:peptidoglycan/xylan/chitin deacetylase (PgdA/CDA1 family)